MAGPAKAEQVRVVLEIEPRRLSGRGLEAWGELAAGSYPSHSVAQERAYAHLSNIQIWFLG